MSLVFDGASNKQLNFTNINLNGETTVSIVCWARVDNLNKDHAIFILGPFTGGSPIIFWRDDDSAIGPENNTITALCTMGGNEERAVAPDNTWNDTEWHHIAFTVDTTSPISSERSIRVYFDGILQAENSGYSLNSSFSSASETLRCGNVFSDTANKRLVGEIEDFRVYTRKLNDSEILTIYNSRGQDNIINDLIARATFASGVAGQVASTIVDISSEKQPITVIGNPLYGDSFSLSEKRRVEIS